jgi:hypothetical protein
MVTENAWKYVWQLIVFIIVILNTIIIKLKFTRTLEIAHSLAPFHGRQGGTMVRSNKIKVGDIVSCDHDNHVQLYIYTGEIGKKYRLVLPGVPGVSVIVERSKVWRSGPWR